MIKDKGEGLVVASPLVMEKARMAGMQNQRRPEIF